MKKVFVGLSGGVDSSMAALRLQKQGYEVVGVFIKVWHPDFLECNWEEERLDAMRVAAHLNIPFLTCDAEAEYKNFVADYFISEYKAGRTPNPDVMCNQHVKFGAFLHFALERGADFVATGHYAQKTSNDQQQHLLRGVDSGKDQTYFLWTLTQKQLVSILLPVGDSPKRQIREEAKKANLPVADKRDSQGVCFLGHIDIPAFINEFVNLTPGDVLNESGEVIGEHKGALVYTRGQRHGFSVSQSSEPQYVVHKDCDNNTITVSATAPKLIKQKQISIVDCNWITKTPEVHDVYYAEFRYHQQPVKIKITSQNNECTSLELLEGTDVPDLGQSCVLYTYPDNQSCIGGGIIDQT